MEPPPNNTQDEIQTIAYLEFADIFRGDRAKCRKPRAIKKILGEDACQSRIQSFCSRANVSQDTVPDTLRSLLTDKVFANPIVAKLKFPHLFQFSAEQLKDKESMEFEAAESEADAIAASVQDDGVDDVYDASGAEPDPAPNSGPEMSSRYRRNQVRKARRRKFSKSCFEPPSTIADDSDDGELTDIPAQKRLRRNSDPSNSQVQLSLGREVTIAEAIHAKKPNLFPVYLPFLAQHQFMNEVQDILEVSCHKFVGTRWPNDIKRPQFKHPQSADLPMWVRLIQKRLKESKAPALENQGTIGPGTIKQASKAVESLRHTAVHRLRTHSKGIEKLLEGAISFTKLLGDTESTNEIEKRLSQVKELSLVLENDKIIRLNKVEMQLRDIEKTRREMDIMEKDILREALESDKHITENLDWQAILGLVTSTDDEDSDNEMLGETNGSTIALAPEVTSASTFTPSQPGADQRTMPSATPNNSITQSESGASSFPTPVGFPRWQSGEGFDH